MAKVTCSNHNYYVDQLKELELKEGFLCTNK